MKIPFVNRWIKFYWWIPDMDFGYYHLFYDAVRYWVLNLWLFSVEMIDADVYSVIKTEKTVAQAWEDFVEATGYNKLVWRFMDELKKALVFLTILINKCNGDGKM